MDRDKRQKKKKTTETNSLIVVVVVTEVIEVFVEAVEEEIEEMRKLGVTDTNDVGIKPNDRVVRTKGRPSHFKRSREASSFDRSVLFRRREADDSVLLGGRESTDDKRLGLVSTPILSLVLHDKPPESGQCVGLSEQSAIVVGHVVDLKNAHDTDADDVLLL